MKSAKRYGEHLLQNTLNPRFCAVFLAAGIFFLLATFISSRHQTGFLILAITNFYMTVVYFERWCIQKALEKQPEKVAVSSEKESSVS